MFVHNGEHSVAYRYTPAEILNIEEKEDQLKAEQEKLPKDCIIISMALQYVLWRANPKNHLFIGNIFPFPST